MLGAGTAPASTAWRAGGAASIQLRSSTCLPVLSSGKDAQFIPTNVYLPKGSGKPSLWRGRRWCGRLGTVGRLRNFLLLVGTERQFPTAPPPPPRPKELFLLVLAARSPVSLRSWLLSTTRKAGREDEGCCVLRAQGWDRAVIPRGGEGGWGEAQACGTSLPASPIATPTEPVSGCGWSRGVPEVG